MDTPGSGPQSARTHSADEVQRLNEVYRHYRESGIAQARWSLANPGNQAMARGRTRVLGQMLHDAGFLPLTHRRILDVGCGSATVLAGLMQWGALPDNLYGVDLLPDRVEAARQCFPQIHCQVGNAEHLKFQDASFDLVLLFTVFSSILDARMARNVAGEVNRVLKPGGAVVWYDFRYDNPANPNVRGMTRAAIRGLFTDFDPTLRTVTLLPPLARRLGGTTSMLYPILTRIPFLRTHYLGLLVKRE